MHIRQEQRGLGRPLSLHCSPSRRREISRRSRAPLGLSPSEAHHFCSDHPRTDRDAICGGGGRAGGRQVTRPERRLPSRRTDGGPATNDDVADVAAHTEAGNRLRATNFIDSLSYKTSLGDGSERSNDSVTKSA